MNTCNTVKELAIQSEKQYVATTVCATNHMEIHPPRGKTGTSWEHTNIRSVRDHAPKAIRASSQCNPIKIKDGEQASIHPQNL